MFNIACKTGSGTFSSVKNTVYNFCFGLNIITYWPTYEFNGNYDVTKRIPTYEFNGNYDVNKRTPT